MTYRRWPAVIEFRQLPAHLGHLHRVESLYGPTARYDLEGRALSVAPKHRGVREPGRVHMAFVVVHNRRIVAARYAHGANKDTRLESWSMGKSIAGTWIGMLIRQGVLKLEDRAPFSRGGRRRVAGGSGGPQACAGAPRGSRTRAHALVQILA